ncbi:HhH-GPD family protein [Haloferax prahovense DSM 18310]|uniref:HhH-GPD family protein n=1 Tax=Haloferax prahovense (strain DSM 18310 / JCM 13924 / TL6) TaxID=1227461 RepID=M0G8Q3_HALPT|nr:base excision DNA repair protein [Haloferax prahovense]ELZ68570.1 HhH-GPD family protein [Haloferax prahovense DSM 18310]
MDESRVERFRVGILEWSEDNVRRYPWRDPESSLYEVFVAEFFLTQTPAENVAQVYPKFLSQYPSLEAVRRSDVASLADAIEPLGFQNIRSEALFTIASEYDSLPTDPTDLRELPRVGEYVANATACFALDAQIPILDRNVDRIYSRVFADEWPESPSEQTEFAAHLLPEGEARKYNLALLDFAAAICTPEPRCSECFANEFCMYYQSTSAGVDGSGEWSE